MRFILRKQIINKFLNFHYFCLVCCDCVNNDWNASINTNFRQICRYKVEYTGIRTKKISAFENDRNIICFTLLSYQTNAGTNTISIDKFAYK